MATVKRKGRRAQSRAPPGEEAWGRRKVSTVIRKAPARRAKAARRKTAPAAAKRFAGVGNEAVFKATGRTWDEWLKALDRAGAKKMAHKDVALLLSRQFKVPNWWSQMVTVGYEQARGLRKAHQAAPSGFAPPNASRTMAARDRQASSTPGTTRKRVRGGSPTRRSR